MKNKKYTQCFAEEPHWHGCVKLSISTNFIFQLAGDSILHQTRKILMLPEYFEIN